MRKKYGFLFVILAVLLMCLTACGEEEENVKKGKTRGGQTKDATPTITATSIPTDGPEPTGPLIDTPTPTMTPDTPTPTPQPTNEPTPPLSPMEEDMVNFFGMWVDEDGQFLYLKRKDEDGPVIVYSGNWASEDYGLGNELVGVTPLDVDDYEVYDNKRDLYLYLSYGITKYEMELSYDGKDTIDYYLEGYFVGSLKRAEGVSYPFTRETVDPYAFYEEYYGFWSDTGSSEFLYMEPKEDGAGYVIGLGAYHGEWYGNETVESIVKSHDGKRFFLYLHGWDIPYDYEDREAEEYYWTLIWEPTGDNSATLRSLGGNDVYYVRGVTDPDSYYLAIPVFPVVVMYAERDAFVSIGNMHLLDLKNDWKDYLVEGESSALHLVFRDPESGRKMIVDGTDGYVIVSVKIKK